VKKIVLKTPLGEMFAIANEKYLLVLEFIDRKKKYPFIQEPVIEGFTPPLISIQKEIEEYFAKRLKKFNTPTAFFGTPFQQKVWLALKEIPYGTTRSYQEVAAAIGHPLAYRAVGSANGANPLTLIIPCHRVVKATKESGGYRGGASRKKELLKIESKESL
jgi:AraC family transcriptional regulator of adaptative response/methylated-DNA-[protein]-cysteine methyltransferase